MSSSQQAPALNLQRVSLASERVNDWAVYPFCVPTIKSLSTLTFTRRICFFTGANKTGKSTLLEALAAKAGVARQSPSDSAAHLAAALDLAWSTHPSHGFYLPAEESYNLDKFFENWHDAQLSPADSKKQSLGQTFLKFANKNFAQPGIYFLDEPEDDLTPQEHLQLVALVHYLVNHIDGLQFVIATHCSTLLAYPYAQIFSFSDGAIHETTYRRYFNSIGLAYTYLEQPVVSLLFVTGLWRLLLRRER